MTTIRLPFAPLLSHLEIAAIELACSEASPYRPLDRPSTVLMARIIGVTSDQIRRWRNYGVTADQADKLAVALGLHPLLIWPEWHEIQDPRHRWRHVRLVP